MANISDTGCPFSLLYTLFLIGGTEIKDHYKKIH